MSDILLHICCGICASWCFQKLKEEGFKITGFFYNPNIYPESEYKKRLEVVRKVSEILRFELIEGDYDKEKWYDLTKEFKDNKEGGRRCEICFKMRLEETKKKTEELKLSYFTTTLTISPHKDSVIINNIGRNIDKDHFLERDFKKENVRLRHSIDKSIVGYGGLSAEAEGKSSSAKADGFKKAMEFSKIYNLYRQNYCGCIYSKTLNPKS